MRLYLLFFGLLIITISCNTPQAKEGAPAASQAPLKKDSLWFCNHDQPLVKTRWLDTELGRQKALIVYPEQEKKNDNLIVFLHGDSPFGNPSYQYRIARTIAEMTNSISVAVLRPGYEDGCGDVSKGDKGMMMGDNYSFDVVQSLSSTIKKLQEEFKAKNTTLIGHSGGAALTALLTEENPELVHRSILIACPCNLEDWRKSMHQLTSYQQWLAPMEGESPVEGIHKIKASNNIFLFVGKNDVVTPPFLSEEFFEIAKQKDLNVKLNIIENADHETVLKAEDLKFILETSGIKK